MTDQEKIYWQYYATLQILFGATDKEIETDQNLKDALERMTRLILKWRSDKMARETQELRAQLLKEVGIPTIFPKGK